ncbi:MAG: hypothetical protein Kapaf2KO_01060 [Candidatus Kapaibacteriales bacterium]
MIQIYTDGAARGNPGPGGYGAVLIKGDARKELSAGYRYTTNNRMEMLAVIVALTSIKNRSSKISLYTDSKLIVDTINLDWLSGWKSKGWRKADKKPVLNKDLWMRIDGLISVLDVEFIWVKGHAGNEENERCDELATWEADNNASKIDNVYERENKPPKSILELHEKTLNENYKKAESIKPAGKENVNNGSGEAKGVEFKLGKRNVSLELTKGKYNLHLGSTKIPSLTRDNLIELSKWITKKLEV